MRSREVSAFALGFAAGVVALVVILWSSGGILRRGPEAVHAGIVETVRTMPPPSALAPVPVPQPVLIAAAGLGMPIAGIDPAKLPDTFHQTRGDHPHEALDIMAPRGTPVVAVDEGNVIKLFTSKQGGLTVYQFDDAREFCYYYAHLDRYAAGLKEGTLLRRGDVLGFVGSTGNASPEAPHLHFTIFKLGPEKEWWQGTAIDPLPFLQTGAKPGSSSK